MKGLFGAPAAPSIPAPPPPPTRDDPAIEEAKKRLRLSEAQRRGRRASMLAAPEAELGDPTVTRPAALDGTVRPGAQLLG